MKIILFNLSTILLFSCSREIVFKPGDVQKELVVSAIIQPEGMDSLLLTSTYITKSEGVSGAIIAVTHKEDTIGRYFENSNGIYFYKGDHFHENKEYSLSIHHSNYPSVSAKTRVPVVPEFWFGTFLDGGEKVKQYFEGDIMKMEADVQVLLEFEDDGNTNNYYMIRAASTYNLTFEVGFPEVRDSIVAFNLPAKINSKSSIIEMIYHGTNYQFAQNNIDWESGYRVSEYELYFSDKLFQGQKVSIPLDVNIAGQRDTRHILHLTLTSLNEEYYQILRSIAAYDKSKYGFFPEALQLYGNINNGHGLWAAKSSKTTTLDISEIDLFNYK